MLLILHWEWGQDILCISMIICRICKTCEAHHEQNFSMKSSLNMPLGKPLYAYFCILFRYTISVHLLKDTHCGAERYAPYKMDLGGFEVRTCFESCIIFFEVMGGELQKERLHHSCAQWLYTWNE